MDPALALTRPPTRTYPCLSAVSDDPCAVKVSDKLGVVVILSRNYRSLAVYELGNGNWVREILLVRPSEAFCLSHDGDSVLATQPATDKWSGDAHVQFVCLRTGIHVKELYLDNGSCSHDLYDIACNRRVVVLLENRLTVTVVCIATGTVLRRFRPHPDPLFCCMTSICLLPRTDGRVVVVIGDDRVTYLTTVDLTSGEIVGSKEASRYGMRAVVSSHTDRLVAHDHVSLSREDDGTFTDVDFYPKHELTGLAATEDGGFVAAVEYYWHVYVGLHLRMAWVTLCSSSSYV